MPRLVHRLDKETSGILVLARSADSAAWICEAFKEKTEESNRKRVTKKLMVKKGYWAIVEHGKNLRVRGTIKKEVPVDGGKLPAVTVYWCKEASSGVALLKLMPITGNIPRKLSVKSHKFQFCA